MGGDIDRLRLDPSAIEHLGVEEIVDFYAEIIGELERPPIRTRSVRMWLANCQPTIRRL